MSKKYGIKWDKFTTPEGRVIGYIYHNDGDMDTGMFFTSTKSDFNDLTAEDVRSIYNSLEDDDSVKYTVNEAGRKYLLRRLISRSNVKFLYDSDTAECLSPETLNINLIEYENLIGVSIMNGGETGHIRPEMLDGRRVYAST